MDGSNSEGIKASFKETQSPSLIYNQALLEAFQRSAERTPRTEGHVDSDHKIICIGGSLGKGVGHFGSDLDVMGISDDFMRSNGLEVFVENIEEELEQLTREGMPYAKARNYLALGQAVIDKQEARLRKLSAGIVQGKRTLDEVELFETKQYKRTSGLLERAGTQIKNVPLRDTNELFPDGLARDLYTISTNNIVEWITEEDRLQDDAKSACLIFSSTPGINAYEITPGNLQYQQQKVVAALRECHDNSPDRYGVILDKLRITWKEYKERVDSKYPQFVKEMQKTRGKNIYQLHDFFKFEEFPDLDELENFFTPKNTQTNVV